MPSPISTRPLPKWSRVAICLASTTMSWRIGSTITPVPTLMVLVSDSTKA